MWPAAAAADCATSHFRIKNNYQAERVSESTLGRSSLSAAGVIFKMEAPTKERVKRRQLARQAARTACSHCLHSHTHTHSSSRSGCTCAALSNQSACSSGSSTSSTATCQGRVQWNLRSFRFVQVMCRSLMAQKELVKLVPELSELSSERRRRRRHFVWLAQLKCELGERKTRASVKISEKLKQNSLSLSTSLCLDSWHNQINTHTHMRHLP